VFVEMNVVITVGLIVFRELNAKGFYLVLYIKKRLELFALSLFGFSLFFLLDIVYFVVT